MVFSSVPFLFLFLPIVFVLHLVLRNRKLQNALLILASLLFYAWGEKLYVLLMIASVFINWLGGLLIARFETRAKLITALAVVFNIGMLFAFKYVGLFVQTLSLLPGVDLPSVSVHLPIGISFFTFQALSYVIDVYRDRSLVQKSFFSMLLYISFFPQLIAGPIVKYHDIQAQLQDRQVTLPEVSVGIRRFMIGLSKKLLIADVMALTVDTIFAAAPGSLSGLCAWLGAICYLFQIYFDFSGYSDMAIGLGKMFGFTFKENFRYPYAALGIRDFWRRWHISLSTWFREYLYIPLGGNRKGNRRTYLNLLIVFASTGLWHGANFTFLVWGLYHGLLLVLERTGFLHIRNKALNHFYTLFAVLIGFVIFRADNLAYALEYLARMFTPSAFTGGFADALQYLTPYFIFTLVIAALACLPVLPSLQNRLAASPKAGSLFRAVSYPLCMALFLLCIMVLASNSYSPFIYFRF